jgi:hypothetical protein
MLNLILPRCAREQCESGVTVDVENVMRYFCLHLLCLHSKRLKPWDSGAGTCTAFEFLGLTNSPEDHEYIFTCGTDEPGERMTRVSMYIVMPRMSHPGSKNKMINQFADWADFAYKQAQARGAVSE